MFLTFLEAFTNTSASCITKFNCASCYINRAILNRCCDSLACSINSTNVETEEEENAPKKHVGNGIFYTFIWFKNQKTN